MRAASYIALAEIAAIMVLLLIEGYLAAGILAGIFIAANIMFAVRAKDHAQFLGALLDMITRMLQAFPGTIAVAAIASIAQTVYLIVWALMMRNVIQARQTYSGAVMSVLYLLFSLRWTLSVLHSIVSGVASASMRQWLQVLAQQAALQDAASGEMVPGQLDEEFGLGSGEGDQPVPTSSADISSSAGVPEHKATAPPAVKQDAHALTSVSLDSPVVGESEHAAAPPQAPPSPSHAGGAVLQGGQEGLSSADSADDWSTMDTSVAQGTSEQAVPHGVATGDAHMPLDEAAEASSTQPILFPLTVAVQGALPRVGAIVLGSLLGIATPLLWPAMRLGRVLKYSSRGCISRLGGCLSLGAERALARTHKYALVSVLWDKLPWMEAAQRVWRDLISRGTEAVVAEDKVDRVLLFCCCTGGATALLLTGAGVFIHGATQVFSVFWIGFAGVALFLSLVDGADAGLIVAFTEAPELVSTAHWTVYHRFVRIAETHQVRNRPTAGQ